MMRLTPRYLYDKPAVCPSVLLRVLRASRPSFTSAEHPGTPLFVSFLDLRKTSFPAMGMACQPQRNQEGAQSAGDIRGGRYAVAVVGIEKKGLF